MSESIMMQYSEALPYISNMYVSPTGDDTIVITCTVCVAEMSGPDNPVLPEHVTRYNSHVCQCQQLECVFNWSLNHIARYHVLPQREVAAMEKAISVHSAPCNCWECTR